MEKPAARKSPATWFALVLALALIIGGGWFFWTYWRRNGPVAPPVVTLSADTSAELKTSDAGGRNPVPNYFVNGKGAIVDRRNGLWMVNSGPYQMLIRQPAGAIAYEYHFSVRSEAAVTKADVPLIRLALELTNPSVTRGLDIPPEQTRPLRDDIGQRLYFIPLNVSDEVAHPCRTLWEQYVIAAASDPNHASLGTQLLDAVADAGAKSASASRSDADALVASVRQIIPPTDEAKYRAEIDAANKARAARATTRAATRATTRRQSTPGPAATTRRTTTTRPTTLPLPQP